MTSAWGVRIVFIVAGLAIGADASAAANATRAPGSARAERVASAGAAGDPRAAGAGDAHAAAAVSDPGAIVRSATGGKTRARAPHNGAPARRLEATHIAGEISVPQVLFITARDQRRFMDFHHQRYLRTSRQLADATPIPSWMTVTRNARMETSP